MKQLKTKMMQNPIFSPILIKMPFYKENIQLSTKNGLSHFPLQMFHYHFIAQNKTKPIQFTNQITQYQLDTKYITINWMNGDKIVYSKQIHCFVLFFSCSITSQFMFLESRSIMCYRKDKIHKIILKKL